MVQLYLGKFWKYFSSMNISSFSFCSQGLFLYFFHGIHRGSLLNGRKSTKDWLYGISIYYWQMKVTSVQFSSVQLLSYVWLFVTPWTAAHLASLSTINSGACSNSRPSSQWCHPTISSSVIPFSSCLQSCPASESSLMSQFFASGSQSIKSFSISISPSNEYPGLISFRIGSPCSLRDS